MPWRLWLIDEIECPLDCDKPAQQWFTFGLPNQMRQTHVLDLLGAANLL